MKLFSKSLSTSLFASVALVGVGLAGCTQNSPSTKEEVKTSDSGLRHIRVATEAAYPPFNDTTPDGRIVGFDVDVIQAACTA